MSAATPVSYTHLDVYKRQVYENIAFALIVKALCLLLVAVGTANMWAAIFGDVGVMVIAVLNAIRACLLYTSSRCWATSPSATISSGTPSTGPGSS